MSLHPWTLKQLLTGRWIASYSIPASTMYTRNLILCKWGMHLELAPSLCPFKWITTPRYYLGPAIYCVKCLPLILDILISASVCSLYYLCYWCASQLTRHALKGFAVIELNNEVSFQSSPIRSNSCWTLTTLLKPYFDDLLYGGGVYYCYTWWYPGHLTISPGISTGLSHGTEVRLDVRTHQTAR